MHSRMRRLTLSSLAGMLALALVTVAWAIGIGSSQAEQGSMRNCPQPGKWAISVWSGNDGVDTGQALSTCGAEAVVAAYYLDTGTQGWLRWFLGQREISNLATLNNLQGIIALGSPTAAASASWNTGQAVVVTQGSAVSNCPQPGKWAISVWGGQDGTDVAQALSACGEGEYRRQREEIDRQIAALAPMKSPAILMDVRRAATLLQNVGALWSHPGVAPERQKEFIDEVFEEIQLDRRGIRAVLPRTEYKPLVALTEVSRGGNGRGDWI
jgi:hypothetical protein